MSGSLGRIALWAIRILLALTFTYTSLIKFAGADRPIHTFDHVGVGQWLRYLVAVFEVLAVIGVLIPRLTVLVCGSIIALMLGAIAAEATMVDGNPVTPAIVLAFAAALLWGHVATQRKNVVAATPQ